MEAVNTQIRSKLHAIETEGYNFERSDSFTYLGSLVTGDNNVAEETANRVMTVNRIIFWTKMSA